MSRHGTVLSCHLALGAAGVVVCQAFVAEGLGSVSREALVQELVDYNLRGLFRPA
jgi:hypothetical protein